METYELLSHDAALLFYEKMLCLHKDDEIAMSDTEVNEQPTLEQYVIIFDGLYELLFFLFAGHQ